LRALLFFLLCAIPATALLLYLDRDDRPGAELPEEGPPAGESVLLAGTDLADDYGQAPFSGAVRRLDGFELRVVEEGYFKLYLRMERLGRDGNEPRLEEVRAAIFDPPKDGKPNLRMTLRAPFVRGDPRELLNAPPDAPKIVILDGGVEAFDAAGRPLAEVPRLSLDLRSKTASADVPLLLRLPERAEVRAAGLDADLEIRKARLKGPVVATVSGPQGTITLRAKGGATVDEVAEGAEMRISFDGDAEVEQDAGRATCQRIDAAFSRADGKTTFLGATLSGGVRLELAPGTAHGIETIDMPSLRIEGEDRISCEGPLRATWRGRFSGAAKGATGVFLPLGDRTVTIGASSASFRLGQGENGAHLLREARFTGFAAADTGDGGALSAGTVVYDLEKGSLVFEGEVDARTTDGNVAADRLSVSSAGKDDYDLRIDGKKRIAYRAGSRLGPLGEGGRGELRLTSAGGLRIRARGDAISFRCEEDVVATTEGGARLRCDLLAVELEKGTFVSLAARGRVEATEPDRGARITGSSLTHEAGATTVEGDPASITTGDGRSVRAPTIVYRDDGTFVATGGMETETPLSADLAAVWHLHCRDARGTLAPDGKPLAIEARGDVRAAGPSGEEVTGDALTYDGTKGVATLLGAPARIRRGEELALVAPKGLSLRIENGRLVQGSSLGPSTIDYRPVVTEGEKPNGFHRWLAELNGPARFEGDRVVIALGAKLQGFDDGDKVALLAEAKRVEILLDTAGKAVTVKEVAGSLGVRVEGKGKQPAVVTADRLSYAAGTQEVRVAGNAQVVAEGWPREVRFRELLFALAKEGIDLKRASEIEVR